MDIFASAPYLIGNPPAAPEPLARYLPPVTQGAVSAWLGQHVPAGAWVLDPFGASPIVAVEAARAGYRVLVAANNPISRFLLEMAANPPSVADLQAGLAELGASRKEDERLEQHIQSLYQTVCANCHRTIQAEAFIWDSKSGLLEGRIYTCPHCEDSGEKAPDISDAVNASKWSKLEMMHRSRALERIAPTDDPDRVHAEEALAIYLPRTVYALGTIINRIELLKLTPQRRRALTALVLTACDQASGMRIHPPDKRRRPRSLALPPRFRENNLWQALEDGINLWAGVPEAGSRTDAVPRPAPGKRRHLPVRGRGARADSPSRGVSHVCGDRRHPAPQPGLLDPVRAVGRLVLGTRGGGAVQVRAAPAPLRLAVARRGAEVRLRRAVQAARRGDALLRPAHRSRAVLCHRCTAGRAGRGLRPESLRHAHSGRPAADSTGSAARTSSRPRSRPRNRSCATR